MRVREFNPEQIAVRTAEGLARMAADDKSTKRPNQHLQPQRRPRGHRKGMSYRGLLPLSQESMAAYVFDGNAVRRKAKPERRKKTRRALRAGRKPYQRSKPIGPKAAAPSRERRAPDQRDAESKRQVAVKAAVRDLYLPPGLNRVGRSLIANKTGLSLGAVQNAINALQAKPFSRLSRKGNCNLPRRKQAWLRAESLKKRRAAEIQGWPKDERLPRRLRKVIRQRRKVREAFDAR